MLGSIEHRHVVELLEALSAADGAAMLKVVERLSQQAPDYEALLAELLSHLQQIAIAQAVPGAVDENLDEREAVLQLAAAMPAEDVQLYYQIGLLGRRDLQLAPDARGGLEMTLLRMLAFRPAERASAGGAAAAPAADKPAPAQPAPPPAKAPPRKASSPAPAGSDWRTLVDAMDLKGVLRELAMNCAVKQRDNDRWLLVVDTAHQQLLSKERQQRLEQALGRCLQQSVRLDIEIEGCAAETPAQQQRIESENRQAQAVSAIESDPNVKAIQKAFDATLHLESVRPLDSR